ncbi:amino acid ABC transporter substrate-binding protein [Rhodovastum atsumiense]|uniref:Amino acid ABC transporter substrate-binding protein n=2 Tax=Rhodovastum atsumiense TaxID=504468 RepID=A0A5M6IYW4_9PROT|nr:amino acid ABC transporter substrate-binding protein [Rhodovastum atsumiense]
MSWIMRLAAACLLAAAAIATAPQPAASQTLQDIVSRGEIRIGYIPAPPSVIKDPVSGELGGFSIDGAREIARMMGVKPVFIETTWGNFVAGLQSGQFDLSIAGTFATVQRAMVVQFTRPIFYLGYGAVVRTNDTRFKTLEDINAPGVKIAVVQGGSAEDYARRNMPKAQVITLATGNLTAGFVEVAAGRADVSIEDAFTIDRFVTRQPSVRNLFAGKPYNFTPIAWSVRRGNAELANVINTGIEVLLSSGRWDDMTRGLDVGTRFIDAPNFVAWPRPPAGGN